MSALTRADVLDRFVENLRPPSHAATGATPTHFDLSVTPADLRQIGAKLLAEYDAAGHPAPAAPVPVLVSVTPDHLTAGGPAFILTVKGTDLHPTSVIRWNGVPVPTTVKNPDELTGSIAATSLVKDGAACIDVVTPPPGGGASIGMPVMVVAAPVVVPPVVPPVQAP